MRALPTEALLNWATEALGKGATVLTVKDLHGGLSPWLLRIKHDGGTCDVVLRAADMVRIWPQAVATGAAALGVAEAHGLAAPRLLASDLGGHVTGVAATLETAVSGSSASPPRVSSERLRAAGAALARVHAVPLLPGRDLPLRLRASDIDDFALERRWATLYRASQDGDKPQVVGALCELTGWSADRARQVLGGPMASPLLHLADEWLRRVPRPQGETVLVHGDIWAGNMLWSIDTSVVLIDWKAAGAGDPGVDLGQLRLKMAVQYGPDAPAQVLDGWQRESGRQFTEVAYWDVVAAVNSPVNLDDYEPGLDDQGREIGWSAKNRRRDAFLREALDQLGKRRDGQRLL